MSKRTQDRTRALGPLPHGRGAALFPLKLLDASIPENVRRKQRNFVPCIFAARFVRLRANTVRKWDGILAYGRHFGNLWC